MPAQSLILGSLRAEAAATRANLVTHVQHVEDQLNVPQRIRNEVSGHPLKWAAITLGTGYVALKLLPTVFRLVRKPLGAAVMQPLLATAATSAWPLVADYLKQKLVSSPMVPAFQRNGSAQ